MTESPATFPLPYTPKGTSSLIFTKKFENSLVTHLPLQTSFARGTGRAFCVAYAYRSYVGGVALVAGVGKGVGKSGVVAMAVEGDGDENGGKLLNRSLFCPSDELCECP